MSNDAQSEQKAVDPEQAGDNLAALQDVDLTFSFLLGRTRMTLDQLTEVGEQAVVELDSTVGEPIDVLVNGKLFARGEVVTIDEHFGVQLTDIIRPLQVIQEEEGDAQ